MDLRMSNTKNFGYLNSNFAERIQSKYKLVDNKIMKSLIDSTKSVNSMSQIQITTSPYLQADRDRYLESYKKSPYKVNSVSHSQKSIYEKFDELKKKDIQQKFINEEMYRRKSCINIQSMNPIENVQSQPIVNDFFKLNNRTFDDRKKFAQTNEFYYQPNKNSVSKYLNKKNLSIDQKSCTDKPQTTI